MESLPSWKTLVVSLNNSAPNGKLTMSTVKVSLFNEEARRKEMGMIDSDESRNLISQGSKKRGRGRGHKRDIGRGQPMSQ